MLGRDRGLRSRKLKTGARARLLKGPQHRTSPSQSGHESTDRDVQGVGGFLVGQPLDSDEVQDGPLVLGEGLERLPDLSKADATLLGRGNRLVCKVGELGIPAKLCGLPAPAVDESVVQDREEPRPQVAAATERRTSLIRAYEGIVDEVLRLRVVSCEDARVALQRTKLP